MAKKDKKDKKLKDKSKKVAEAAVVEENLDLAEETEELESAPELVEELEVEASVEEPVEAPKARAKRAPKKKFEAGAINRRYIDEFPVADIIPREKVTRFHSNETKHVVTESVARFGIVEPLILDEEHRIVSGQYRYELALQWKLETLPVVIVDSLNAEDGTTDLFHMLAGRVLEWDKWNFPGTDAVLKGLDGGIGTEKVLDFETISEAGELRALAKGIGWFVEVIPKSLSGSTVTLETLAGLLKKSLAGKYQYDPAQLLYIEALREQLESVRREMVANGETAGGVKPKLEQHVNEEARKLEEGEAIAEANGYEMKISEDGKKAVFTADAELAYVVNKVAEAEEAARVQIRSARDMESRFKEMADGKKMGLTQFKILATMFGDMTIEEAGDFFNGKAATEFNAYVDEILEENRTLSPNRSKNFPMTEAELKAEQYRLRGEDIKKDAEKKAKDQPKGLSSLLVDDLKELLKTEGLPLGGKKADLVARLEAAGYGPDGVKGEVPASEAEEAEDAALDTPAEAPVEDEDVSMVFAADESEDLPEESAPVEIEVKEEIGEILSEAKSAKADQKALKKRKKELKAKDELTKAERKELKAITKELKG